MGGDRAGSGRDSVDVLRISLRSQARRQSKIVPATAAYLQRLKPPLQAHAIAFAERHRLLPESYLYGLTDILILAHGARPMHLFGRTYPSGRWFYFRRHSSSKRRSALCCLPANAFARPLWRRPFRRELCIPGLPPAVCFGIAMTSKMDMGIRHVLPIMPFLIVLAAAGFDSTVPSSRGSGRVRQGPWFCSRWLISVGVPQLPALLERDLRRTQPDLSIRIGRQRGLGRRPQGAAHRWRRATSHSAGSPIPRRPIRFPDSHYRRPPTYFSTLGYPQPEVPVQIDGPVPVGRGSEGHRPR